MDDTPSRKQPGEVMEWSSDRDIIKHFSARLMILSTFVQGTQPDSALALTSYVGGHYNAITISKDHTLISSLRCTLIDEVLLIQHVWWSRGRPAMA